MDVKNDEFNIEENSYNNEGTNENIELNHNVDIVENKEENLSSLISENVHSVESINNNVENQNSENIQIGNSNNIEKNSLSPNTNESNNNSNSVNNNQMNFDPVTGQPLNNNINNNQMNFDPITGQPLHNNMIQQNVPYPNMNSNNLSNDKVKKKKGKKKFIFLGIVIVIVLAIFVSKLFEPDKVTKTDYIQIDAIYVDDSVIEGEDEELRTVYVFYTATANDKNLSVDAKSMKIWFKGSNNYESTRSLGDKKNFFSNHYYSSVLEDIYMGSSLKVLETFEIPKGELVPGKTISFSNYHYSGMGKLKMSTDDFKHMKNFEEIAKDIDPDAYYKELDLRADADTATTNKVKNAINNYYWKFYTNMMWYKLEFYAPNNFNISGSGLSNTGKYYVKKGYVALSYDNGATYAVYVKYNFKENGEINLEAADSFSVF